jgi:hypothetical protein
LSEGFLKKILYPKLLDFCFEYSGFYDQLPEAGELFSAIRKDNSTILIPILEKVFIRKDTPPKVLVDSINYGGGLTYSGCIKMRFKTRVFSNVDEYSV